jgi:hypothetical protein
MLETINKILALPQVERYRKVLIVFAIALLGLHVVAFGLNLALPDSARADRLANFSYNLYGVTGGLLLIVVLGAAIRALTDADQRWRLDTYHFIQQGLTDWFTEDGPSPSIDSKEFLQEVIHQGHTDFKVRGAERLLRLEDRAAAQRYCSEVHFEFTFYPTKVIYGIHFESPSLTVNETMCAEIRAALAIHEESGFVIDHQIPKKPDWIFFIRTVEISGDFGKDMPSVMTHARHFVELIGHGYAIVYSDAMAERFASLGTAEHSLSV